MHKRIMIFSPHLDDETLGAGGTLLKHVDAGDDVYWVIYTATLRSSKSEYKRYRKSLVEKVANEYGFKEFFLFDFPAGELDTVGFKRLVDKTIEAIRKVKPNVVYTVGKHDVNTDHDFVYRAVMVSAKPSIHLIEEIYAYEISSSTNWAFAEKSAWFEPNVYVDIEPYIERKLEILSLFEDQIFDYPHARSLEAVKALAMYRGASIGTKYAEAFKVLRIVKR